MKLTTIFVAIFAVIAGAILTEAVPIRHNHPVPWKKIHHKKAMHWKIYAEPAGTNLRTARPVMRRCKVHFPSTRDYMFNVFKKAQGFEFQELGPNRIGLNCIDCSPQEIGNVYLTKIGAYIECKEGDHRPADWQPKHKHDN